jgi:hypothetical protein
MKWQAAMVRRVVRQRQALTILHRSILSQRLTNKKSGAVSRPESQITIFNFPNSFEGSGSSILS